MTGTPLRDVRLTEAGPPRRGAAAPGRGWLVALIVVLGWSLADTGLLAGDVFNPGGWPVAARFLAGAAAPDLTADYLAEVGRGVLVTLAYAVLGTIVSVLAGLLGAVLVSRRWWRGPGAWLAMRVGLAVPRGLHEALWGLLLVTLFGPDPLAAVLAIAIPYGAITAKVYADLLDEAPAGPYEALRAAGAGRVAAFCYALLPYCAADMLSYALYRFDCAIRSAVILGIVGAGGIGLLLDNAFQDLSYGRMWTSIYALLLVCAAGDQASRRLRSRLATRSDTRPMWTAVVMAATASFAAALYLRIDLAGAWSAQARAEAAYLLDAAWPPALPAGGLSTLAGASAETLQMSVLALVLAAALAIAAAPLAAAGNASLVRTLLRAVVRAGLLVARVVPAPVWALLLLFMLHPGPLPGALALAAYNLGVLGRLMAEVVEDLDPAPATAVATHGAGPVAVYAYAVLPRAIPRFLAYVVYRWEVAVRETVIVGMVGAGGLGYLLARQLAAFQWPAITSTLLALIALTCLVDVVGSAARQALR